MQLMLLKSQSMETRPTWEEDQITLIYKESDDLEKPIMQTNFLLVE